MPRSPRYETLIVSPKNTPGIILQSVIFAAFLGVLGGALPAFRAARITLLDALRA